MILAGHQPNYLPYIGFFDKIMKCDKFVLVDHVQFEKKGWQNRNRIRTKQGGMWLTVPVFASGKFDQRIVDVEIDNKQNWRDKHWKSIYYSYKDAPYFETFRPFFEWVYEEMEWKKLVDLNIELITYFLKVLGINTEVVRSSDYNFQGKKTDLLIEMCEFFGADTYLSGSGPGARRYVDKPKIEERGLKHMFQEFEHPVYRQQYEPFMPNMSAIDLLFNFGPKSIDVIRSDVK